MYRLRARLLPRVAVHARVQVSTRLVLPLRQHLTAIRFRCASAHTTSRCRLIRRLLLMAPKLVKMPEPESRRTSRSSLTRAGQFRSWLTKLFWTDSQSKDPLSTRRPTLDALEQESGAIRANSHRT